MFNITSPRITEIQTNTVVENWFWVETSENPSDLGTREKVLCFRFKCKFNLAKWTSVAKATAFNVAFKVRFQEA